MVPDLSYVGASNFHVLFIFSFLHQLGFKTCKKALSSMTLPKGALKRYIDTVGAETIHVLIKKARDQKLFYACDEANKGGHRHTVKRFLGFM